MKKIYVVKIQYSENDTESVVAESIRIENGKVFIEENGNDFAVSFSELVGITECVIREDSQKEKNLYDDYVEEENNIF